MDWQLCVICGGGGNLKCPAESNQKNGLEVYLEVYRNFLHSVEEFEAAQSLPVSVDFKGRPKNNTQKLSGQFVQTNQSLPGH